jgi:aminoglycoside phosphotransferase (APT) family kinase protein
MPGSTGDTPALSVPHGYGDDARSRFLRSRPPSPALAWVEVMLGGKVTRVRALRGGSSSAVHAVRVEGPLGSESVILRRYVIPELNVEEPDIAEREARVLRFLHDAITPTPHLIAVDATGADAGVPAVLMTRVPGRLDWSPKDMDAWLRRLAAVLPPLHAAPLPSGHSIGDFAPYVPESWERPEWMQQPDLWERALEIFHGPQLDAGRVFIHRDYHPGNVLWCRGRVTGVVDWQAASVGPPSADVSWCRINLIGRFGLEVADRFIDIWETMSGRSYHPWSEVVLLVDLIGSPHERKRREREDLERALAQRLTELRA